MIYTKNQCNMSNHASVPSGETSEGASSNENAGNNSQTPPQSPPYEVQIIYDYGGNDGVDYSLLSEGPPFPQGTALRRHWKGDVASLREDAEINYGEDSVWPPTDPPPPPAPTPTTTNEPSNVNSITGDTTLPLDPRLTFIVDSESVIYSFSSAPEVVSQNIDGFIVQKKVKGENVSMSATSSEFTADDAKQLTEFYSVPAIMNSNAYVNLIASGGKVGLDYLVDRENQPRWYDVTANAPTDGTIKSSHGELTVKSLIEWTRQAKNYKFPYKYQDFVFLKYWKKIPLNYMITLRRYTRPTNDNMGSGEEEKGEIEENVMLPAAQAITFLGEDAGNKLSSILGPIEAKLKWKEVKADVWEVSFSGSPAQADSPFPGVAKALGFLTKGPDGAKPSPGGPPPDPYNNGPYANKIIGPVTVIDKTKARDRGIEFAHAITLQFEYSARSIGGINAKAAMLDILGNIMLLTFNEAAFWGGMNRHMPQGAGGNLDPFLGGPAGRAAWLKGDPAGFFKAVSDQFMDAGKNIADAFSKLMDDPIGGLKSMAGGAASSYMKMNTTGGKGFMQGMHSLLTGAPVGEWHMVVGNPMNPMMMVGNLICTGCKIEFNDELGPDDFPTELKATITLEHGMPRDRAGIESMFNKGSGRIYSVPKGYEESFSSTNATAVDTSTGVPGAQPWGDASNTTNYKASGGTNDPNATGRRPKGAYSKNPLLGDPAVVDNIFGYYKQSTKPRLQSIKNSIYAAGVKGFSQNSQDSGNNTNNN